MLHIPCFLKYTGVRSLEFYDAFFSVPYPLPKLDMICITEFAMGAMEVSVYSMHSIACGVVYHSAVEYVLFFMLIAYAHLIVYHVWYHICTFTCTLLTLHCTLELGSGDLSRGGSDDRRGEGQSADEAKGGYSSST